MDETNGTNGQDEQKIQEVIAPPESVNTEQPQYTAVTTAVPPPSQVPAVPTAQGPGRKKVGLFIGAAVFIFAVLAVGVTAFLLVQQNNKPEKVLADALVNTASDILEKKPSTSVGSFEFVSKGDNPASIKVAFEGASSGENGKGSADVTVDFAGQQYTIKSAATVFGSEEYYVKIENLKQTLEALASNQPDFSQFVESFEPIISKIDNQWVRITKSDLKEFGALDEEKLDACANTLENLQLSRDDKKQLKRLFSENQFIVAGETFAAETASGEKSFRYRLDFNDKAAENFAKQVLEMQSFTQLKKDCDIDEAEIKDQLSDASNSTESREKPVVELWVGKKTRRPTKFHVSTKDKDVTVDFNTELRLGAEGVTIEKPSKSISIQEVQREFQKITNQSAGAASF